MADPYELSVKERGEWKTEVLNEYQRVFKASDLDKSGFIEPNEVPEILKALGYRNFSEDQIKDFMKEADLNQDGKVSFKEFLHFMKLVNGPEEKKENITRIETKAGKGIIKIEGNRDSMSFGSFSEEERTAYVKVINSALAEDEVCKKYLPLDPNTNDIFPRLKNGIILCKLINKASEGTIDERVINCKDNMTVFQETENVKLALSSARSLGCKLIGIGSDNIRNEDKICVLGLLWQIVKQIVLIKITLKNYPQLVRLLEPGEELADLLKLSPENILLRWFNFHLKNANYPKKITNFNNDVKDSEKYTILLNQLDKEKCDLSALQDSDLTNRAQKVLTNAKKLGTESYINPKDIVSGNNNLNLLFTVSLLFFIFFILG
ncbi:MAG: EF-hand domain-containing protein [archaeon]|nr:EF-hand domain-containing protein [archaeon]